MAILTTSRELQLTAKMPLCPTTAATLRQDGMKLAIIKSGATEQASHTHLICTKYLLVCGRLIRSQILVLKGANE
jgi:hypothetical protein